VIDGATINLDTSAISGCTREGILVGLNEFIPNGPQVGHATVTKTDISGYRVIGIQVGGPDTTIKVTNSKVVAADAPETVGQAGIGILFGPKASIVNTKVSNNLCNDPACGPDFFNQTQGSRIVAIETATGTVISDNDVSNNDLGIVVAGNSGCCNTLHNKLKDNRFFGITLIDGISKSSHDIITGGNVGIAAVAINVVTTATLIHDKITGTTTPTQELSCCGFTAKVITIPPNSFQSSEFKSAQTSEVRPDFLKKKFGLEEPTSISSSLVSPFYTRFLSLVSTMSAIS